MTTTSRLPAIILGTHITALGVLRDLVGHGIQTYVIDRTDDMIVRSRWYRPTERMLLETTDSDQLGAFLESLALPSAVLITCSDRWTDAVAGLAPEVGHRFKASVPPRDAVEQFIDKDRFRALVDRLAIPYPRSVPISGPDDIDRLTDDELAHGFLKPTDSQRHHLVFGTKGSFVRSRAEATRVVERAAAAGISFILQEWIPGGPSNSILIDGFVDRGGTITTITRRRVRMDPPRIANSSAAVTIAPAEGAEAEAAVRRLLPEVGYRGIFNAEFKFDARDGRFKIIEVNPRPFWLIAHVARAGLDLPWMSYLDAQEIPVPPPPPYEVGRYGLIEIPDVAALVRAWGHLRRPEGPVLRTWLTGDRALFWWRDPLPALVEGWRALGRRVRVTLGGVRGRRRTGR
jgi:predicted ATP-grasp superfamily ATP-dependent carboligase